VVKMDALQALIDTWEALQAEKSDLIIKIGQLEMKMRAAMTASGATYWDSDQYVIQLKAPTKWDEEALGQLREFFGANELADLKNTVKPPKFNKRKLRTLEKRGGEVGEIIQKAQSKGAIEVAITKKGMR
tara:strand:+ start:7940 stop:8329 length:390 start_codon:yes stop_codon:yes gene_type:complete